MSQGHTRIYLVEERTPTKAHFWLFWRLPLGQGRDFSPIRQVTTQRSPGVKFSQAPVVVNKASLSLCGPAESRDLVRQEVVESILGEIPAL